jgi:hypothetical protein
MPLHPTRAVVSCSSKRQWHGATLPAQSFGSEGDSSTDEMREKRGQSDACLAGKVTSRDRTLAPIADSSSFSVAA